jgi:hypothetical protein
MTQQHKEMNMRNVLQAMTALFTAFLLVIGLNTAQAQDTGTVTRISYYTAVDANGIQQVYQLLLDGQSEPRQITFSEGGVLNFGVAYDGLSIAYISGGQLWLQPIHTEVAEPLASLSSTYFSRGPVYSQDGQYIAYADNGIWLLDLATRETRQILADVPLAEDASNMADYRIYLPEVFVLGADGKAAKLVVDVGVWEWNSGGIYDLATGELTELEVQAHTHLLPLYGDRVLIYGNNGVSGDMTLRLAESIEDINTSTEIVKFSDLTDQTLFAEQAVEIAPGTVRIYGSTIGNNPDEITSFYFDYDLMAQSPVGEVNFITLAPATGALTIAGDLSPDGALLPVYPAADYTQAGTVFGAMEIRDLATGDVIEAPLPETVGEFHWQP